MAVYEGELWVVRGRIDLNHEQFEAVSFIASSESEEEPHLWTSELGQLCSGCMFEMVAILSMPWGGS